MILQQHISRRDTKTSQPRFKRIQVLSRQRVDTSPRIQWSKNKGLDSAKENIYFQQHLTKVKSQCKIDQTTMVTRYLNNLRRGCDQITKNMRKNLTSMKIKKRDISLMKVTHTNFISDKQQIYSNISRRQAHLQMVKEQFDYVNMQYKILENMANRMKKDKMFYKNLQRVKQQQTNKKGKQLKQIEHLILNQDLNIQKLYLQLKKSQQIYQNNKNLRLQKYSDYSNRIAEVKERDKFVQQRQQRTYQLQSIELNDTLNQKNIHMRQMFLAHKVAQSLLQGKVATLLKQNQQLQSAFHVIKQKTSICEPKLLTSKFFSYNQASQQLISTIRQHELKLQHLNQKKRSLTACYDNLKNQNLLLGDNCITNNNHIQRKDKLLLEINQRKLLIEQIRKWVDKRGEQINCKFNTTNLASSFQNLCIKVKQLEAQCNKINNIAKIPIMGIRFKKLGKQMTAQQLQGRLRQSQQMNQSNIIEQQYLKTSRLTLQKQFIVKTKKQSFLR